MTKKYEKLISTLDGNGIVLENNYDISHVNYHIDNVRNFIVSSTHDDTSDIPGTKSMSGTLQVVDGRFFPISKNNLELLLEDGRKIKFTTVLIDTNTQTYNIRVIGGFNQTK